MCGKTLIDELPEVVSDRLASMPVGDAEITYGVLREAIEAFAKDLSSISFHIASNHSGGAVFAKVTVFILSSWTSMLLWAHRGGLP